MADRGPELWERQPGETAKAFAAFCAYRDLPRERRSVRAAYEVAGGTNVVRRGDGPRAPRPWRDWGWKNAWEARAEAWDREQDRLAQAELMRMRVRSRLRRVRAAERALDLADNVLATLERTGGAQALGPMVAARLLNDALTNLRAEYGDDPAKRVEVSTFSAEDEEQRRAEIRALIEEAVGLDPDAEDVPVGDTGRD